MWSAGLPVFGIPGRRFESSRATKKKVRCPFLGASRFVHQRRIRGSSALSQHVSRGRTYARGEIAPQSLPKRRRSRSSKDFRCTALRSAAENAADSEIGGPCLSLALAPRRQGKDVGDHEPPHHRGWRISCSRNDCRVLRHHRRHLRRSYCHRLDDLDQPDFSSVCGTDSRSSARWTQATEVSLVGWPSALRQASCQRRS